MEDITLNLPDDVLDTIRSEVRSGAYASESEVVSAALRLFAEEQDHQAVLDAIRAKVAASLADPRPPVSLDEARRRLIRTRVT
ncbi:type II toxin-antitoxin system ParD family antitoxin [Rhizobium sp. YIM 134829]|uniref:ribbon-helix-helix domain-containing protein n=1 Tax=Rhizobium sp. YIM 134829 TaxID=3390453 RepID=UPI00397D045F